jgi:N-carbamoyl-L-amino-acid hydrolase
MRYAEFGKTPKGGVNRQALSKQEVDARRALINEAKTLGALVFTDPVGNFFVSLSGTHPELAPVLTGSHIDSQPTGGKFDGIYGILAGLEVLKAIRQSEQRPKRSIEVVSWMNEEGSRFAPGMMGSAAFAQERPLNEIVNVVDEKNISVQTELEFMASQFPEITQRPLGFDVHCFIEAHIEQGPVLEEMGISVGVVTGIQGKKTYRITVEGEAAHAGTTPNLKRRDALVSATRMIQDLVKAFEDPQDKTRFTVGRLVVEPNAPSVIPSKVIFSIDLRHENSNLLVELGQQVQQICLDNEKICKVSVVELSSALSLEFPKSIQNLITEKCNLLEIKNMSLLSCAGHDSRYLHGVCETGMIFVPCKNGISHHESEFSSELDLYLGAKVLADVLWDRANQS